MATVIREFKTIHELVEHTKKAENEIFKTKQNLSSRDSDFKFRGTHNWTEAEKLLLNGWDEGAKQLTKELHIANLKPQPKEIQRATNDIVGFQANVPRYLQGIPTNMINKKTVKTKQKVVTLVKSISYNSSFSKEKILQDSVKFLQLVQAIEKKGFRVNAYTIWDAVEGNESLVIKTKIKSSSERLTISKIAFPLMHPSFLRRVTFRCLEVEPELKNNNWKYGYGRPGSNTKKYIKENEYYVPIMMSEYDIKNLMNDLK